MTEAARARTAAVLVLLIACGTAGWALVDAVRFFRNQRMDETAMYAWFVEPFRSRIPKDEVVGCTMDLTIDNSPYLRAYYNVRYVLSPTRVVWKPDRPYVIGLFADRANLNRFARENGYEVVQPGNGYAVLMRKRTGE